MKPKRILSTTITATALLAAGAALAQIPLSPTAEAMIRDGSNFAVDMNEASLGYLMVKNGSGSSGKAYFKFNFAGLNPNTNDTLGFTFTTYTTSGRQRPVIWALDQAYPDFNSSVLIWQDAQANETNGNSLLTDPVNTYTGTPLVEFISPGGGNATRTVIVPAPWGQFLFGDELVLVITSPFSDLTNQATGLRLAINQTYVSYQTLNGAPPSISAVGDITTAPGENSPTNSFTVGDPEDGPNSLFPMATSSDESVVPSSNVFFAGTGANRTVYVVGANSGVADITVNVSDISGNMATRNFRVKVITLDYPPLVSEVTTATTLTNTPVTIPFTASDAESPATSLIVTGEVASYSGNLLASLSFGSDASGTNRTVTVTPLADANGVGIVTLTVADTNNNSTSISFAVMILPAPDTVFSEHFDYPLNTSIINSSPGFWLPRNSSPQSVNLRISASDAQAWIRPKSGSDDVSARLAGAPYLAGAGAVLYTKFKAQWVDVGDVPPVGDSSGPFVLIAPDPTASADQICQLATRTNGVSDGFFRLLISNGTGNYTELSSANLSLWNTYSIVVRYDVDSATSTVWVDATDETAPGATATDRQNPVQAAYVCLRQEPDMGNIYLDDLTVVAVQRPTLTNITPPAGGNVDIFFSGGPGDTKDDFAVERAAEITGAFGNVSATFTDLGDNNFKAQAPASGSQGFYRVKRQPMAF